ncbi:MAG TPA: CHAT domain-containing tetratricopeptide repeat protein, partial [Thermoanaerobaculia bacterium]|nr:CHAT domain-containing tetratricopeptide repeat protein [Thermoanaerobaculia bacterium]
ALKNLAQVYWSLGLPREALTYADDALGIIHGVALRVQAHILTIRGNVWRTLDEIDRSLEDFNAALILRRRLGDREGEAYALTEIARLQAGRGDAERAIENLRAALRLSEEVRDVRRQAGELALLGRIEQSAGDSAGAERSWDRSLVLSRSIGDRAGESSVLFARARNVRDRGDLARAADLAEQGLALLDSVRAEIPIQDLRASYAAWVDEDRRLLTEILIARYQNSPSAGMAEHAFDASERTRARSMAESIAEGRLVLGQEVSPILREREREANERIAFLQRRLDAAPGDRDQLLAALTSAEEEFDRVVMEIRRASPRAAALRYPRPQTAQEVRAFLPADEAMVSYFVGREGLYAFVLTQSRLVLVPLPVDVRLLPARVENFVELLSRGDATSAPMADRLSADLLEPLRSQLGPSIHRLVIVPDGPLNQVPFEALPVRLGAGRGYLIEEFAVAYAPSATVLAALSETRPEAAAPVHDLVAFAGPATPLERGESAEALIERSARKPPSSTSIPGARREVEAIVRYASRGSKVYVGGEASETRFKQERLDSYRIVHLATHGLSNQDNPGRAALLLAASPGDQEDGLLQAREISSLALGNALVVLSGCETARGRILSGEGVQSLARAFFVAGAPSVVASLWNVRDEATEKLMTGFYRRLSLGQSKEEALRGAKLEMLRRSRTASPRDWAAFVLIGEASRTIPLTPSPAWRLEALPVVAVATAALSLTAVAARLRRRGGHPGSPQLSR